MENSWPHAVGLVHPPFVVSKEESIMNKKQKQNHMLFDQVMLCKLKRNLSTYKYTPFLSTILRCEKAIKKNPTHHHTVSNINPQLFFQNNKKKKHAMFKLKIHSQIHNYLDSDYFCNFASAHHHNRFEMQQSRCDWSVDFQLWQKYCVNCFVITAIF